MPLLDVSDVLDDPDFREDGILVERNAVAVDDGGMASLGVTNYTISGVVCSASGSSLMRVPEGERNTDFISLHTKFRLISGEDGNTADVITYMGKRWTVYSINDYTRYGTGFVQALCQLIPMTG
jgi:hypothetical protein